MVNPTTNIPPSPPYEQGQSTSAILVVYLEAPNFCELRFAGSIGIIKLHEDKPDVIRYLQLMKYLFLLCCLLPNLLSAQTAQEILQQVRLHLPQQPITFNGTLKRKTANGFNRVSLPIQTTLRLSDTPAHAHYRIGETTLDLHWENNQPVYTFSDKTLEPTHEIANSGMSWIDLSLGFLWWPNPALIGPTRKDKPRRLAFRNHRSQSQRSPTYLG